MDAMLFSPLQIRALTLRNRIVLSPMLQYSADAGYVNDWHLMHYGKFAAGGAGLVFVESTKVDPRGCTTPRDLGLWKDDYIEPLRRITDHPSQQRRRRNTTWPFGAQGAQKRPLGGTPAARAVSGRGPWGGMGADRPQRGCPLGKIRRAARHDARRHSCSD
jgi:hypothetical protein